MRAILTLVFALIRGNLYATLTLVSFLGTIAWRWKSVLDEHLARRDYLNDPVTRRSTRLSRPRGTR